MKKILIVNYEFPPLGGGGGVATYELARELSKKYEVHCLTSGVEGLKEYELVDGIHVHRVMIKGRKNRSTATFLSMLHFVLGSQKMAAALFNKKFDYLWTWFAIPSGIAGLAIAKKYKIPHTLTIVGGDIYDPSKKASPHRHFILRKIVSYVINHSDRITAISNDVKQKAFKYFNIKKDIEVLPLAFRPVSFEKSDRKTLGLNDSAFYFVTTGRLVKRKGFSFLINALALMKNKNARLILIGDGPLESSLKNTAKSLNVEEMITFAGYVEEKEKYQYLSLSDCYVLSSLHEGFGIVLQEAMQCELPIISTNRGGQTDFLAEGVNAILVPVKDAEKLANAMDKIIDDPLLSNELKSNNVNDIRKYYAERITKAYEATICYLEK